MGAGRASTGLCRASLPDRDNERTRRCSAGARHRMIGGLTNRSVVAQTFPPDVSAWPRFSILLDLDSVPGPPGVPKTYVALEVADAARYAAQKTVALCFGIE